MAFRSATASRRACSGSSGPASPAVNASRYPSTDVSGVRSSCEASAANSWRIRSRRRRSLTSFTVDTRAVIRSPSRSGAMLAMTGRDRPSRRRMTRSRSAPVVERSVSRSPASSAGRSLSGQKGNGGKDPISSSRE
jgi:hypothetical protein